MRLKAPFVALIWRSSRRAEDLARTADRNTGADAAPPPARLCPALSPHRLASLLPVVLRVIIRAVLAGSRLRLRSAFAALRYGCRSTAGAQIITGQELIADATIAALKRSLQSGFAALVLRYGHDRIESNALGGKSTNATPANASAPNPATRAQPASLRGSAVLHPEKL